MRQSHLIISNAAIIWVTRILSLVPQLIMVPFLIHRLGDDGYGVYALIWSLMMSLEQLQMSLQQGVVKYSAAFAAQGQTDAVNRIVSSSFVYSVVLAVLACAGILIAAAFYNDPSGQIGSALVVGGITVLFVFPLTPYIAIIQSRQRYYVGAIAATVSKYISLLVVMAWFHWVGSSVGVVIVIMAGALFLSRLAQVPIAYRMVSGLQNRPSLFDWTSFRLIASFGGMVVLLGLCLMVNTTGIRWLMGILVSTSFVAHLAIMVMPGLLLNQIVQAVTITIMPATSAYEAAGNNYMLRELLLRSMRYTAIIVLAGLLVAVFLVRDVLTLWVGSDYVFLAPYTLVIFASVAFLMTTSSAHHMLKGLGKLRTTVLIAFVGKVIVPVTLVVGVFFVSRNPYLAVTAGLAAGNVVSGVLHVAFGVRAVNANWREVLIAVYALSLVTVAIVWLLAFALITCSRIDGLIGRTCVAASSVLLFLGACYSIIATATERKQLKELLAAVLDQVGAIRSIRPKTEQSGG